MSEKTTEDKYYRVTDIIGPKKDMTEVILETEVSMRDLMDLEEIASQRNESLDDILRNVVHEFVRQNRVPARKATNSNEVSPYESVFVSQRKLTAKEKKLGRVLAKKYGWPSQTN